MKDVSQAQSPRAFAVLQESQAWGEAANESGNVDVGAAISKLHELLNKTIGALAEIEAEANKLG